MSDTEEISLLWYVGNVRLWKKPNKRAVRHAVIDHIYYEFEPWKGSVCLVMMKKTSSEYISKKLLSHGSFI